MAELRLGRGEDQAGRQRELDAAAEALPAHCGQDRPRPLEHRDQQRVQPAQHRRALPRKVLLDARAEAEVRALGVENRGADRAGLAVLGECRRQRGDHRRIDDVRLGSVQSQAQQRAVAVEPDLQW
ncbi:MAG: hypothetical protein M5U08_17875 [Burkholderiales bacterium]|nr:hypothetical protein [Burkholderiales bacterium]